MTLYFLSDDEVLSGKAVVHSDVRLALIIHAKDENGRIRCVASDEVIGDNYNDEEIPNPKEEVLESLKERFVELYSAGQFSKPNDNFTGRDIILTNANF